MCPGGLKMMMSQMTKPPHGAIPHNRLDVASLQTDITSKNGMERGEGPRIG